VEGLEKIRSIRMADGGAVLIAIVGDGRSPLTASACDLGTALVVDDDATVRRLLERVLTLEGSIVGGG
jgi:hypothetical protein